MDKMEATIAELYMKKEKVHHSSQYVEGIFCWSINLIVEFRFYSKDQ